MLWYAAHPLAALESAGIGHVEPIGVAAAVLAALLVVRRRPAAAGVAAAAAGLLKLAPFAALPMWARQARELGRAHDGGEPESGESRAEPKRDPTR